jgi:hypothetical protein
MYHVVAATLISVQVLYAANVLVPLVPEVPIQYIVSVVTATETDDAEGPVVTTIIDPIGNGNVAFAGIVTVVDAVVI